MENTDRTIGRLQEFMDRTTQRLEKIETKIDVLHEFKWRVAGGASVLSIIITTLIHQLFKAFKN